MTLTINSAASLAPVVRHLPAPAQAARAARSPASGKEAEVSARSAAHPDPKNRLAGESDSFPIGVLIDITDSAADSNDVSLRSLHQQGSENGLVGESESFPIGVLIDFTDSAAESGDVALRSQNRQAPANQLAGGAESFPIGILLDYGDSAGESDIEVASGDRVELSRPFAVDQGGETANHAKRES